MSQHAAMAATRSKKDLRSVDHAEHVILQSSIIESQAFEVCHNDSLFTLVTQLNVTQDDGSKSSPAA